MQTISSELITMSAKEIDRLTVIQRVRERRLSQKKAADMLGVSTRQLRRLAKAYGQAGARGLVSKRRGRQANNATPLEFLSRTLPTLELRPPNVSHRRRRPIAAGAARRVDSGQQCSRP